MNITLQTSLGKTKIVVRENQEEILAAQITRFLQQMAQTGQNGNGAPKRSANGHNANSATPKSVPAEIIGRTGYQLYPN